MTNGMPINASAYKIVVANQKGGVAKTTTAASLAGALVRTGMDILVVDLDPQANLTLSLGVNPLKVQKGAAEALLNSVPLLSLSRETSIPGLDLVPSNAEMEIAERFLPIRNNHELLLRKSMTNSKLYDFIVMDCPPSMGAVTLNALTAANLLIIPTQPEYFSAHALRLVMMSIRNIRAAHNPGLDYRILITMQDLRNRIHRSLTEQIQATFSDGLFRTIIGIDTKVRESAVAGLPITHYRPATRSAQQYQALAEEITEYAKKEIRIPA